MAEEPIITVIFCDGCGNGDMVTCANGELRTSFLGRLWKVDLVAEKFYCPVCAKRMEEEVYGRKAG